MVFATRGAANFPRIGNRVNHFLKPMLYRRSPAAFITPMVRCSTRSTITVRSSKARCLRRASPAAIATNRMLRSFAFQATDCACNVMLPTSTKLPHIIITRG